MKSFKRFLALFVALVMCLSCMSLPAFATDGDLTEEEEAVEQAELTESKEDGEQAEQTENGSDEDGEPVEEIEAASDEDEEPVEEAKAESDEDEAPVEETEAASDEDEEPVEETESASDEDKAKVEQAEEEDEPNTVYPDKGFDLTDEAGGYVVTVKGEAGSFAEKAIFRVIDVKWDDLDDATAELLKAEGLTEDDALLDIGFISTKTYEEVEPLKPVAVSIEAVETEIAEVWHVEHEETVTQVAEDVEDVAEFEVEGFSIFAVKTSYTEGSVTIEGYDSTFATLESARNVAAEGDVIKVLDESNKVTSTYVVLNDSSKTTVSVTEVASGFYQSGATYTASTDFYITSKAGFYFFRYFINYEIVDSVDIASQALGGGNQALVNYSQTNPFSGKTVHFLTDVDLENDPWIPIGWQSNPRNGEIFTDSGLKVENKPFYGNFDGHGHTISNLNVSYTGTTAKTCPVGLFGNTPGTQSFSNLTIHNITASGYDFAGGLIGNAGSNLITLNNCHVTGSVNISASAGQAGGLIGLGNVEMDNCSVIGTSGSSISAPLSSSGGLAGNSARSRQTEIKNSSASGLTVSGWSAGGIVGTDGKGTTLTNTTVTGTTVNGKANLPHNGSAVARIGNAEYTSLAKAIAAVPADGTQTTITMVGNETIVGNTGVTIAAGKNVVLDLNGYTIAELVTEDKAAQVIDNLGTLTVTDTSVAQTGTITNAAAEGVHVGEWWSTPQYNYATNTIRNKGTLNIISGTITNTAAGSICYAVDNNSTSSTVTLNVSGGKIVKTGTPVRLFCNSTTYGNTINVTGGEISGKWCAFWVHLPGSKGEAKKAAVNISGGTLKAWTDLYDGDGYGTNAWYDYSFGDVFDAVEYQITGGLFIDNEGIYSTEIVKFISGGTFSSKPDDGYIATGYTTIPSDAEGSYSATGDHWTVVPEYTVTWKVDGQEDVQTKVGKGATPVYSGIPTKAESDGKTYTFTGWSPALTAVTGDVTYTARFAENSTQPVTNDDGSKTTTAVEDDKTTTTTEGVFKTTGEGEQQKVDTTVTTETTTNETTGVSTKTETLEQTTTTEKVEGATLTVTVETTKVTTTTVGESAPTTETTPADSTTTTVTLQKEDTTSVATSAQVNAADETVSALISAAQTNEVTTEQVDVAAVAKEVLAAVQEEKAEEIKDKDVTVTVTLTLEPTLTEVKTETEDETTNVTSLTFDVKPMMQATVKIGDDGEAQTFGAKTPVDNAKLTATEQAPITVKLPITSAFGNNGDKVQVKHTSKAADGTETIEYREGTISVESEKYYVTFTVTHFSTFEIVPTGKVYVSFNANGGSITSGEASVSIASTVDPDTVSKPNVSRSGYTLSGWTKSTDSGNTTYTAQWTANPVVSYDDTPSTTQQPTTTITDEETPLSEFPISYIDVAEDSWYHGAVAYVTALGVMNGVGEDRFDPNASTTRGMVATVLMRLANGESVSLESFHDVASSAYYAEAAAWAVENGVFLGYDDGSFRGDIVITREQFAAVLYRYASAMGYSVAGQAALDTFCDAESISDFAVEAMGWAVENGIILGVGGDRLDPSGNATRAQLATMLMRFDELVKGQV